MPASGPTHAPLTQLAPRGHAAPQFPQLLALVAYPSTHVPAQQVPAPPSVSAHAAPEFSGPQTVGAEHCPPLHVLVATQPFPQLPQLSLSVAVSVQLDPQQTPNAAVTTFPVNDSYTQVIVSSPAPHSVTTHSAPLQ